MTITATFGLYLSIVAAAAGPDGLAAARAYRGEKAGAILREFAELLAIPNNAADAVNIRRNAVYIRDALGKRGVKTELWESEGAPPVVFGEWKSPGADRTIGIYAHYDGQPVVESQWTRDPWQATLYTGPMEAGGVPRAFPEPGETVDPEWRVYARAAGDDKAPIMALLAALDALKAAGLRPTVNLKILFEGEEEAGSSHLRGFLSKHRDQLNADVWLICDGPVHQSRKPQLVFGVRGITVLDVTVYGANRYLHSGHYGNWAPNPAMRLAHLLASMTDESGRVVIDGFYDSVVTPTPDERKALDSVPDNDDRMRREFGLAASQRENAPYMEQLLLPSLNVRGMVSATVGASARNVIPAEAEASIDIRLVKNNDPDAMLDLVESHIRGQGFHVVRDEPDEKIRLAYPKIARLVRHRGYPAARTSPDLPICREVIRVAERAAGEAVIRMPTMGGSLPLFVFEQELGRPFVIVPIANHDDNQHGPDENLRLGNLFYGIDLMGALLTMPD